MWLRHRIADRFILQPSRHEVDDPEPAARCWVDGPAGPVECFATRKFAGSNESVPLPDDVSPADLLILKLPGTAGRAERSTPFPACLFPDVDVEVWTWNPPGYGRSAGVASLRMIPKAVLCVWDHLLATRFDDSRTKTLLIGNSLGSATALHVGSQRPVHGLMLRNPPPLVQLVQDGNAWWNGFWGGSWLAKSIHPSMDALQSSARCRAPAIFLQSERDTLVTPERQQQIIDAYAGQKHLVVLPEAEHDTPYSDADILEIRRSLEAVLGDQLFGRSGLSGS